MRFRPKTLTSRLVMLLAGMVLLGGAIAGVAGTIGIRAFLMGQLDNDLRQAAARNAAINSPGTDDHDADNSEDDSGLPPGAITGLVAAGQLSDVVMAADLDGDHEPSAADRAALRRIAGVTGPVTVHLPSLGDYRVTVSSARSGEQQLTGIPQTPVNHIIRDLILLESVVLTAAVAVVAGVGAAAVRRSMRPLQDLATVAQQVTELPLDTGESRIPLRANELHEPTEVAQVGQAMNAMLGHIDLALQQRDESERRLREFAADASHELRTPLAVARSHAELLREYMLLTDLPEQVHLSLTRIGEETGRMAGIVDDLLLLARLDSAGSTMQDDVDLTRVLVDAVDDARITSPDHRWSIEVPVEPLVIRADTEQVRRMVTNLVTNVRLHTPAGTTARCELLASATEAVIKVHDTGPGFPPELIDHAHDRFARGRHRESSADSTGLGLAIVHAVAHAQGGSMAIISTPGDTTVMVMLPLTQAT